MKVLLLVFFSFCIRVPAYSQADTSFSKMRAEYMAKSKKQHRAGWFLVGGGLAITTIGVLVQANSNEKNNGTEATDYTGSAIALFGGCLTITSIPFFIGAANNKRRATISFGKTNTMHLREGYFVKRAIPSVSLTLNLARPAVKGLETVR
jgi:hypothetical protein